MTSLVISLTFLKFFISFYQVNGSKHRRNDRPTTMAKELSPQTSTRKETTGFYLDTLAGAVDSLRRSEILTDFTLVCKDGTKLPAHKVILMLTCPFFRRTLTENVDKNTEELPASISGSCMKILLDFMYSGQVAVTNNEKEVMDVINAAEFFELENIEKHLVARKSTCGETLMSSSSLL